MNPAEVTMLYDRVLIRRASAVEKSKGGIILVGQAPPQEGVVVAVGPGKYEGGALVPTTVGVGRRVVFGMFAGAEIGIADEQFIVVREDEILMVLPDEPAAETKAAA